MVRTPLRILIALQLLAPVAAPRGGELELHFLDVGQGSCTLIVSPTGTAVLVDGGFAGEGTSTIVPYLQWLGLSDLEYSVATHWDADHIGGMDEVFAAGWLPTVAAYDRGDFNIPSNGHVSGYLAAVGGQRETPSVGSTVLLGGGASIEFVALNGEHPGGSVDAWSGTQGENSASIAFVLRHGDFDCWIGGDLTGGGNGTVNVESLVAPAVGQVEVVLSNHHGSRTSSNSAFVGWLDPSFVVHQAGHDNPYGHPDEVIVDRWNAPGASRVQWCTTEGDTSTPSGGFMAARSHIRVVTDGSTFRVSRLGGGELVEFATFELAAMRAGPGELVVSELLVDPAASADAYGEWFELVNLASGARSLQGLRIESGASQFTLASALFPAPGARVVIGVDGRESRNGQVFPWLGAPWQAFQLPNASGSLTLRAQGGSLIESLAWGAGGIAVQAGVSDERIDLHAPATPANFADALSAWAGGDLGTPGEVNDNEVTGCPPGDTYCIGAPNSVGLGCDIGWAGSTDVLADDLELLASGAPASQFGLFFYGPGPAQVAFGQGFRCVAAPLYRLPVVQTSVSGVATHAVELSSPPQQGGLITAGSTWFFQFWYRDPAGGGAGFNLSNGLELAFCAETTPPEVGDVVFAEFMADPTAVADAQGEWLEIVNVSAKVLDLTGWTLEDHGSDVHTFGPGLVLLPGERAVLGRSANTAINGGVPVDHAYGEDFTLEDVQDELVLRGPGGLSIDEVVYTAGFFPIAAGRSSTLDPTAHDHRANDNLANWCLSQTTIGAGPDQGTPGAPNELCF